MLKSLISLLTLAVPVTGLITGAGTASALAVHPGPDAVAIDFTQPEAAALATTNLALLGQLPPNFSPLAKQRLGETISRYAREAAAVPGSTLTIIVDTPIQAPAGVTVTVVY
ncbi:hypothetical protein ATK86_4075 [Nocardia fluminea]|uniref:Uncharacterized protein n=1 Tax=Nocardia fluminea TaxID=134984 RepID=A0A2N3VDI6_9NOCA|nr:hypothetical protein ATK86_4075 [Nocardia fluminea]